MENGTVKWFDARRGYGFVLGEDGKDYFVHQSNIVMEGFRTLKTNQKVSFEIGEDAEDRSEALEVQVL